MNQAIQRSIFRWLHIFTAFPILGYIYTPYEELHNFAPIVRYIFVPLLVLSGLWLWKGHVVRRLFSKKPTQATE